jgi:hypothetical protein
MTDSNIIRDHKHRSWLPSPISVPQYRRRDQDGENRHEHYHKDLGRHWDL